MNTMSKKKQPSITQQIATLQAKRQKLADSGEQARITMTAYQKQLDAAELAVNEAVVNQMADNTPKHQKAAQDARAALATLTAQYDQAVNDLKYLPGAISKLATAIKVLRAEKKQMRIQHVVAQSDLDTQLVKDAGVALARLIAYRALRSDNSLGSMNPNSTLEMLTSGNNAPVFKQQMVDSYHQLVEELQLNRVAA